MTKSPKKNGAIRGYGAMQPQQEGCLELIPERTGVVTGVVTGPRKWEIRS